MTTKNADAQAKKISAANLAVVFLAALMLLPGAPLRAAEEMTPESPAVEPADTSLTAEIGYTSIDVDDGGETIRPFGSLDADVIGSLVFHSLYPWGGNAGLEFAYEGDSDYNLRGLFNYKGNADLQVSAKQYQRNSEHDSLPPPSEGALPSYFPEDLDPGDEYRLDISEQEATLKVRAPSYPAHLRLQARRFNVEGDRQLVFLDQNCTTECHNVSRTRPVDSTTNQVGAGADAHLGYFDLSYSFSATRFDDDAPVPADMFGILFRYRNPGELEHNVTPAMEAAQHTFTVSTSGTGRLAATAGFGAGERRNKDADVSEGYQVGSGAVVWRPFSMVSLSARYRRQRVAEEANGIDAIALREAAGLPVDYDTLEEFMAGSLTVRPLSGVRLRVDASRKEIDRDDAEVWELPEESVTDVWRLSVALKPVSGLAVDLWYRDEECDHPAYGNASTHRDDVYAGVTWTPLPQLVLQTSYLSTDSENDEAAFEIEESVTATNRSEGRDLFHAGATLALNEMLSVGLHYSRFRDDVTSDLMLAQDWPLLLAARGASYTSDGDHLLLQADWRATEALRLSVQAGYLTADGTFNTDAAGGFADVGGFNSFDAIQRDVTLSADYRFLEHWSLRAEASYIDYDDRADAANNEILRQTTLAVATRW